MPEGWSWPSGMKAPTAGHGGKDDLGLGTFLNALGAVLQERCHKDRELVMLEDHNWTQWQRNGHHSVAQKELEHRSICGSLGNAFAHPWRV